MLTGGDPVRPLLCNLLFCENVIAEKGKFNLIGVFYRIHAIRYPCTHRCFVVVGWCGQRGSHSFVMRLTTPDRSRILLETAPHPFNLSPSAPYFNGIVEVVIPLECGGVHWFDILVDGDFLESFPLHVITVPLS